MGERVLVTGGCGFIGSEVVRQLLEEGYEVVVLDDLSKSATRGSEDYEFVRVDLTDVRTTKRAFKNIDICINLAAKIGGIRYLHKYPATILSQNNKICSNTFEAAVKNGLRRMIYISSSMVFESKGVHSPRLAAQGLLSWLLMPRSLPRGSSLRHPKAGAGCLQGKTVTELAAEGKA